METDLLNRRLRFAPPNPDARPASAPKRLVLQVADHILFAAIDRHGPLPSHYLHQYTRALRTDETRLKKRLTEFYNGDVEGAYLSRPPQQHAGYEARYQHLVYDLTPRARAVLAELNLLGSYSPRRSDPFLHQLMGACVGASLELACTKRKLRYIPREEILTHPKCPQAAREAKNPMALPLSGNRSLIPDDLFGIEYPGVGFRFFAVEIDRNTESIERKSLEYNTIGKKVANYLEALSTKAYQRWWGIPNLSVLIATTNATHAGNILDYINRQDADPRHKERFALTAIPDFGVNWRVPKEVLYQLLKEPWRTVSGFKDISRP